MYKTQGSYRASIFSNFPDLKKVSKMEIKSEKIVKKLALSFSQSYLIGILRKGCFVIPWCVVSVIPITVMYNRQKLVRYIYSIQKDSSWDK